MPHWLQHSASGAFHQQEHEEHETSELFHSFHCRRPLYFTTTYEMVFSVNVGTAWGNRGLKSDPQGVPEAARG